MKAKITVYFAWLLLLGFLLAAANVSAQTTYRQTNLASKKMKQKGDSQMSYLSTQ